MCKELNISKKRLVALVTKARNNIEDVGLTITNVGGVYRLMAT